MAAAYNSTFSHATAGVLDSSVKEPYGLEQIVGDIARAIELRIGKRLHEALACIDGVLDKFPHFAPGLLNRAQILADLERYEEALADCKKYLDHAPPSAGIRQFCDDMRKAALALYEARLALDTGDIDSLYRHANVHLQSGDMALAEQEYAALLQRQPDHQGALTNHGYSLVAQYRLEEALAVYERLQAMYPGDAINNVNRGNVLKNLGRPDEAQVAYRQALFLKPDLAEPRAEMALLRLAAGDFTHGWAMLEWRWGTRFMKPHYLKTAQPAWLGDTSPAGKTVLIWAEQGFGDTIQFARYVPLVADIAGAVVLRAPAPLVPLLRAMDPRVTVVAEQDSLPPFDCHCPLMSLPLALGLNTVPPLYGTRRLAADPARMQQWSTWLGPRLRRRPRIGVVWAGKQYGIHNPTRDMPLAALLPLADIDADFICLQKDIPAADAGTLAQLPAWRVPGAALADFGDTAALIMELDLVISVDTAVAHLTGALGQPCCMLLRHSGEWRWSYGRSDTPWYPSMQIFRQQVAGRWSDPVDELRARLESFVLTA
jgi:Flp pilus assembly protein TadD